MAANMWENSLKNVESENNKILYETLLDFLQRNSKYFLNKPRILLDERLDTITLQYVWLPVSVCTLRRVTQPKPGLRLLN